MLATLQILLFVQVDIKRKSLAIFSITRNIESTPDVYLEIIKFYNNILYGESVLYWYLMSNIGSK